MLFFFQIYQNSNNSFWFSQFFFLLIQNFILISFFPSFICPSFLCSFQHFQFLSIQKQEKAYFLNCIFRFQITHLNKQTSQSNRVTTIELLLFNTWYQNHELILSIIIFSVFLWPPTHVFFNLFLIICNLQKLLVQYFFTFILQFCFFLFALSNVFFPLNLSDNEEISCSFLMTRSLS